MYKKENTEKKHRDIFCLTKEKTRNKAAHHFFANTK